VDRRTGSGHHAQGTRADQDGHRHRDVRHRRRDIRRVGPERVSRRGEIIVAELDDSLEHALACTQPAAQAVLDAFRATGPERVTIEFGLRLDVSAGVVIAKAGMEAHFTVKLDWHRASAPPGA
jgi:hypothetical protein